MQRIKITLTRLDNYNLWNIKRNRTMKKVFDFEGTIYHDPTKCNNYPVTYPINNRHERRKQKAMKRKK